MLDNLALAFPERDDDTLQCTTIAIWGEIGRVLAEYPHLPAICARGPDQRIELVAHFDLGPVRDGMTPMIFVAAHQSNWNLPAIAGSLGGFPVSVVFRAQRNARLEAMIARWRNTLPVGFIHAATGPRQILNEIGAGRSVGLQMDQRFDARELVPLFGIEAPTTTVPARLALKLGTGLVPTRTERLEGARFRITLHKPIRADPTIADPRLAARRMTEQVHAPDPRRAPRSCRAGGQSGLGGPSSPARPWGRAGHAAPAGRGRPGRACQASFRRHYEWRTPTSTRDRARREFELSGMRPKRFTLLGPRERVSDRFEDGELIGGRFVPLETPSTAHEMLAGRVRDALRRQLRGRPWRVLHHVALRVGDAHLLRPDAMVLFTEPGTASGTAGGPAIVVEVMSPSTAVRDRGSKRLAYFEIADLQHYVLVSTEGYFLEVFSRCAASQWSYRSYSDDLSPMVELADFDVCIHLAAIYQGIELDGRRGRRE
jgi:Kdo2-lipid IVA lauroyltransferase/acyltransferase